MNCPECGSPNTEPDNIETITTGEDGRIYLDISMQCEDCNEIFYNEFVEVEEEEEGEEQGEDEIEARISGDQQEEKE